jgi:hypothetical protein
MFHVERWAAITVRDNSPKWIELGHIRPVELLSLAIRLKLALIVTGGDRANVRAALAVLRGLVCSAMHRVPWCRRASTAWFGLLMGVVCSATSRVALTVEGWDGDGSSREEGWGTLEGCAAMAVRERKAGGRWKAGSGGGSS